MRSRTVSWFMLMAALAAGCGDDRGPDYVGGPGVIGGSGARRDGAAGGPDAGGGDVAAAGDRTMAAEAPRLDSSAAEGAGPPRDTGAAPGMDAGGGMAMTCEACEMRSCGSGKGDLYGKCFMATGEAAAGRASGRPKKDLCAAVIACVRMSGCASERVEDCYCGKGVDDLSCVTGKANGPCKMAIENGAEDVDPIKVSERFFDPSFATGSAFTLVQQCDRELCSMPCLGIGGPPPSDAGVPGTGGRGGTSGASGAGGAGGTGGAPLPVGGSGGTAPLPLPDSAVGPDPDAGPDAMSMVDGASDVAPGADTTAPTGGRCRACEQKQCPMLVTECEQAAGNAAAGPGMGKPRKDLCMAVLECVAASNCATSNIEDCYCGPGVDPIACITGSAAGPCKAQFEAGAESTNGVTVSERFVDPGFATGNAVRLLQCNKEFCDPCPGTSGPPPGPTPDAGAGGAIDAPLDAAAPPPADAAAPPDDVAVDAAPPPSPDVTPDVTPPPTDCNDLDGNGTLDCRESLVMNPDFDTGVVPWVADPRVTQAHDPREGGPAGQSGSLSVTNASVVEAEGMTMAGSGQCIAVPANVKVAFFVQAFIAPGQGSGMAGFNASFHQAADCSGEPSGVYTSALTTTTGVWSLLRGEASAPLMARSMSLRLVAVKPFRQPSFQVLFDNVLVKGR